MSDDCMFYGELCATSGTVDSDDPEHKLYRINENLICMYCLDKILVEDFDDFKMIDVDDEVNKEFAELDAQIDRWAFSKRPDPPEGTKLCDFCYLLKSDVINAHTGYLKDENQYEVIKLCDSCYKNFYSKVDALFADNKEELFITEYHAKYTKEKLAALYSSYTENASSEYFADCSPIKRSNKIPIAAHCGIDSTKNMFKNLDRYDDSMSDSTNCDVMIKEWIVITDGFDNGWYHGHGDMVLAFNCS